MHRLALLLFATVVFGRVLDWKAGRDAAWNACVRAGTPAVEGWLTPSGELRHPRLDGHPFAGRVKLVAPGFETGRLVPGTRLRVRGRAVCVAEPRNPAGATDARFVPRAPLLFVRRAVLESATPTFLSRLQQGARGAIDFTLSGKPGLAALSKAVWLADDQGFPAAFRTLYREGGLLHLLALSGQHVACLSLCLLFFAGGRGRFVVPLFSAALLYATSLAAPSMGRTLGMAIAVTLLYWRRLGCSPLQLTASAVACLLVWDPSWLGQPGFFLSAACTLALVGAVRGGYLRVAFGMAVFAVPLSAYFFGKASLLSPLTNLLLAFFWNGWLVVGFLAPIFPFAWPEWLWWKFVAAHSWLDAPVHAAWIAVPRPSWPELVVIEWLAAIAFYRCAVSNEDKRCPHRKRSVNAKIASATPSRASTISSPLISENI